jgi:hypothetical protein
MKQLSLTITALSLLTLFSCSNANKHEEAAPAKDTVAAATPAPEAETAPPMDSAAMAKAWENYMTPGDMHKWMASMDGKWEGEVSSWMAPDAPPTTSKVTCENKTIMGGRYQESVNKGNMMGMPFEGRGTMAYDNSKKKFISTWIDNMGTGIMTMEGTYDEASKTLNMSGKMTDPASGKDIDMREVVTMPDDKHQVMAMYCNQHGKEFKTMEIKMTKK